MKISQEEFNNLLNVLLSDNYNHRAMIEKIARNNPHAILEVMSNTEMQFPLLEQFAKDNAKIEAIKHVRQVSHMGLRDAKDFVDDYFASNGF